MGLVVRLGGGPICLNPVRITLINLFDCRHPKEQLMYPAGHSKMESDWKLITFRHISTENE
jgi:hypothetical protein